MSILDGIFSDRKTMEGALVVAQKMVADMVPDLDEDARRVIELTGDGSTLGDVLGITKEQKGALLDLGCRLLQLGETDKAMDVLLRLSQLDPYEERAYYALGVGAQSQGRLQPAAQMYLQFLALDATNPMGYLRLGECLLSAKEFTEARESFEAAKDLAEKGHGLPEHIGEARRMLELLDSTAGAAVKQQ